MALYVACVIFAEWPLDAHRMTLGRCPGQILNKEVEQMKRSLVGRGMRFPFVLITFFWGSRNLVGISIQHSDSEEEELFVYDSMQICPEEFDFGIE